MAGIFISAVALLLAAAMAAIMFPIFARARGIARTTVCLSNVKQLTLATLKCAEDHDGRLPPADTRSDAVLPNVKNAKIFKCPDARELRYGHAYNRTLGGLLLKSIPGPDHTVLLFDSALGWNGTGGPQAVPSSARRLRGKS